LTYGEGWHNNHHAFQTSARHGLRWWEVDMTYLGIKLMSFFGIAHSIKLPRVRPMKTGEAELTAGDDPLKAGTRHKKSKPVVGASK
jgi:hypothetical protein